MIKPSNIDSWISSAEGFTSLSRKGLDMHTLKALNELINHAKQRNPKYYDYLPSSLDSLNAFENVKFTTASDLAENGSKLLLLSQSEAAGIITDETSGTTKKTKRVFYTKDDLERCVSFFKCGLSEFIGPSDTALILMPSNHENSIGSLISRSVSSIGAGSIAAGSAHTFRELTAMLKVFDISKVIAMPVQLLSFVRYLKAAGKRSHISDVLVSADTCSEVICEMTTEELGCNVFPHYGSRESGLGGAITCHAHDGMHVWENELYCEIIDENDQVITEEGKIGQLVLTTLKRRLFPLIRYKTGDYAALTSEVCRCGSVVKRLSHVSRIPENSVDITKLDDIIFGNRGVVDYTVTEYSDHFWFDIITYQQHSEKQLLSALEAVLPIGKQLEITTRPIDLRSQKPLYPAKRYVIRKELNNDKDVN